VIFVFNLRLGFENLGDIVLAVLITGGILFIISSILNFIEISFMKGKGVLLKAPVLHISTTSGERGTKNAMEDIEFLEVIYELPLSDGKTIQHRKRVMRYLKNNKPFEFDLNRPWLAVYYVNRWFYVIF
jgi:hypothetical protein